MNAIAVVTGSRADYGLLAPVLDALADRATVQLVVTGNHLDQGAGYTVDHIKADGRPIAAEVPIPATPTLSATATSIGVAVERLADSMEELNPAIVVVLGDRSEALAAAIAATYSGRILAHIHGGEVSGGYDEFTRHAITKLAHLHFASSAQSTERIARLGEEPHRIHQVGAPGIDAIVSTELPDEQTMRAEVGLPEAGPFALFVMHPDTLSPETAARDAQAAVSALERSKMPVVAIQSNGDAGGDGINALLAAAPPSWTVHASLARRTYLALLKHCAVLVGNSSSGIIEAPAFGTPTINVGSRQRLRERAANVIDVPPDADEIQAALTKAQESEFRAAAAAGPNPYGNGDAGVKIADVLATVSVDESLRRKQMTY